MGLDGEVRLGGRDLRFAQIAFDLLVGAHNMVAVPVTSRRPRLQSPPGQPNEVREGER